MADLDVIITCPACQAMHAHTMPVDRCVFFWECPSCRVVSKPQRGDCCVYCSFADKPCPSKQDHSECCGPGTQAE